MKGKKLYGQMLRIAKWAVIFILAFALLYLILSAEHREFKEEFYFTVEIDEEEFIAVCTEWGLCTPENYRERKCYFVYPELRSEFFIGREQCDYQQSVHCFDSLKNYDETDIDCGGSCRPCELGRRCLRNPDCISTYCHPINEICVERKDMPNIILIIFYRHPVLASLSVIVIPAGILIAFWISRESKRIKEENKKTQAGLISSFNYYSDVLRKDIKNGKIKKARQVYFIIMEIMSKMDNASFKAMSDEYHSIKKLYREIKNS